MNMRLYIAPEFEDKYWGHISNLHSLHVNITSSA